MFASLSLRLIPLLAFASFAPVVFAEKPEKEADKLDRARLTIDRIYKGNEFNGKSFSGKWLEGEAAYTLLEDKNIVRVDAATGNKTVMVPARDLTPPGKTEPLNIESYSFSSDKNLVLIYTNSRRVWRNNTRGDYWLLDRTGRDLRKLGGDAPEASLMFAKISPTGKQVAYVRERNIYIEDLLDHTVRQLTQSKSGNEIYGTTDWVYEEELGLRDAFRFSPDGKLIAFWKINTEGVQQFPLVNTLDSLYPKVTWFAYPKVGQRNPSCHVGVVVCATGEQQFIEIPGDSRDHYIPRMEFVPADKQDQASGQEDEARLLIQQLNRLQNTNRVFLADVYAGTVTPLFAERDEAWVDVNNELKWIDAGRQFTWMSETSGWRHLYLASLDGAPLRQVTRGEYDVIELLHVDEQDRVAYFIASPDAPSERYLYRVGLDGEGLRRVTPEGFVGSHGYRISDNAEFAVHTRSAADHPPVTELISLEDHETVRVLESNEELIKNFENLDHLATEFFRVPIGDDIELEAWCIRPPGFDPKKKYPLLVYVYGEPAGTTVVNRWGGKSYLWHLMLAQHGYVVMSFDNRGTRSPRGRDWRKSIYKKIGIIPPADQAAAVESVLTERSYLDADRVGIWGWSGGGSSSLHAIFKHPKLYKTAIAIAPVPNQRYYDTIYQERYMSLPELNVEGFREGSPINFAKQLEGNLLLVHGTGDDNCHYQTTEMLIDELIAHNKQFTLMVYPNRTHSIRERQNTTRHLRQLMTNYLLQNLPPSGR